MADAYAPRRETIRTDAQVQVLSPWRTVDELEV